MKLKVIIHEAEEGGYWAEVPEIFGCGSQGDSLEELLANVKEAMEGCLCKDVELPEQHFVVVRNRDVSLPIANDEEFLEDLHDLATIVQRRDDKKISLGDFGNCLGIV